MVRVRPVERRKHRRFQAQDGALVALRLHVSKLVGQIVDISKGGLAFRYIDIGDRPRGSFQLDILLEKSGFLLEKVPAKTISDSEMPEESPYSSTTTRRQGVQFGELTNNQKSQLEYFIRNHTVGQA
jgi:hypothetical protein